MAPYLVQQIKQLSGDNETLRLIGHALLGAVVGVCAGLGATDGVGAVTGEVMTKLLVEKIYQGDKIILTQAQKLQIMNIRVILAGTLSGTASDSTAGAMAGARRAVKMQWRITFSPPSYPHYSPSHR